MRPDFEHPAVDHYMKSRPSAFRALMFFVLMAIACQCATTDVRGARVPLTYTNRADAALPEGENGYAWTFRTRGPLTASPALSPDGLTLYVASGDRRLYALDVELGESKWTNSAEMAGSLDGLRLPAPIYASPTVDSNGTIFVGCTDGRIYVISDQGDFGRVEFRALTHDAVNSPAIAEDGTIYAGSTDNRLYAFFPDGAKKWVFEMENNVATPVINDDGDVLVV